MTQSPSTTTAEAAKTTSVFRTPLPTVQATAEHAAGSTSTPAQRVVNAVADGRPSTPPSHFRSALDQMQGSPSLQTSTLLHLQRSYGNSYVGRVIQRKGDGTGSALPDGLDVAMQSSSRKPLEEGTRSSRESRDTLEQETRQVATIEQQGGQAVVVASTRGTQAQKEDLPFWEKGLRAIGSGASTVGKAVVKSSETAVEWGEDVGWSLLNKYAPELVPIIRQGVGEWLKEKISSAIETVFNMLVAPVRAVTGVVQSLMAHFSELLAWMREAASEIARGDCSAITKAVEKVQKVIEGIASPIIDRVKHLAHKVGDFFKSLWERFGAPIWDFLKRVGGAIWEKIQQFGSWVWQKTEPIRNLLKRAWKWIWKWIKDKLGVGDEPEGQNGLLQWVQKKAAVAWEWIKVKIEPIKKPLMVVGGVIVMLSPAGPIIAIGAAAVGLIKGIRWIREHLNTPDGVVKNRGVLQDVIIPAIIDAVKGVTRKLASVATSITEKLNKVAGGLGELVGAVGGSILRFAVSAVKWIADQFQGLVQWGSEKLHGLVNWISNGLERLHVFLQPVLDVLAKVGEVIVDILKLPGLIIGKVWKMIPACIRDPFVNFLTNQILKRLPFFDQLVEIGEIWSKIKTGALTAIKQIFTDGNLKGAMITVFKTLLDILKVPIELVMAIFNKAASAIDLILANPKGFFINALVAIKDGFVNFFKNIGMHLLKGAIDWLMSELKVAGISVAGSLSDIWSIFKFILGILGLSMERVFSRLEKKIGSDKVQKLKKIFNVLSGVWEWVAVLIKDGPAGLWTKIQEQLGNLKEMLLGGVISWITENIINRVKSFILTRFNPAGLIITIVGIIIDIMKNLRKILEVVNAVLDSVAGIAKGATSAAATFIEAAIGKVVPVIIAFLADQLGLSGIGKRIQELLKKVNEKVDMAIDWLIDKAISAGKALLSTLGLGGKPDERTPEQKEQDLDKAIAEAKGATDKFSGKRIGVVILKPILYAIKVRYGLQLLEPVKQGNYWAIHGQINPEKTEPTSAEAADGSELAPIHEEAETEPDPTVPALSASTPSTSSAFQVDMGLRQELIKFWERKKTADPSKLGTYNDYIARLNAAAIPTPRQSEEEMLFLHTEYLGTSGREQVSYRRLREVPYGTAESTRPDIIDPLSFSIEVKRYRIKNISGLISKVKKQVADRRENLPYDQFQRQAIIVDLRGQKVSQDQIVDIKTRIQSATDLPIENIEVVTY